MLEIHDKIMYILTFSDGIGKTIYLAKNDKWEYPDEDYTPYKNVISAVWPSLRHRAYVYAIINAKTVDVTTYYEQINQLDLVDPCSHPDAIKCGSTGKISLCHKPCRPML